MSPRLRIIVTGLVGLYPIGGVAWDYLQYIIGLTRLGHDVYYYEDSWCWPYHPLKKTSVPEGTYSAEFISKFFQRYAPHLTGRWHYFHLHEKSFGMDQAAFNEVARTADLFLNVSGACTIPDKLSPQCIKVFLDTDPGYNQIMLSERLGWSENVDQWCANVAAHDRHFTYAENIFSADCLIPKVGYQWRATRVPVVLDLWETFNHIQSSNVAPWTTIMTWDAFKGKLIYKGVEYKSKGPEFEKLIKLPQLTGLPLTVAVGGVNTQLKWLARHGWHVVAQFFSYITRRRTLKRLACHGWHVADGTSTSVTPQKYQEFIAGSRGELSPAKHVYVAMRSGWFSSRSACYLATGRPVVVQDTGFTSVLPVGEGLLSFAYLEDAIAAINEVEADYSRHAKAARAIAEEYFDSNKVLTQLIEDIFSSHG